jgi:hypothetical protein
VVINGYGEYCRGDVVWCYVVYSVRWVVTFMDSVLPSKFVFFSVYMACPSYLTSFLTIPCIAVLL